MNYRYFVSKIKNLPAFNLNDVRKVDPAFHRQQLNYWLDKGYIKHLVGGYYALPERKVSEPYLFMLANRLYAPSYISLESALAFHQVIPETVLGVTSISALKTNRFTSDWGVFSYRSVQPRLMFGYQVMNAKDDIKFNMAGIEKAVLDYLYLNAHICTTADFYGLRWNREQLQMIDPSIFSRYLGFFNKRALSDRVEKLKAYLNA